MLSMKQPFGNSSRVTAACRPEEEALLDQCEEAMQKGTPPPEDCPIALDAPVQRVVARCQEQGINPGYPLAREYPEHENGLLVALTERRTRADIDRLADALESAIAAERSGAGAKATA